MAPPLGGASAPSLAAAAAGAACSAAPAAPGQAAPALPLPGVRRVAAPTYGSAETAAWEQPRE